MTVSCLLVLAGALAAQSAANDNTVFWDGLRHDPSLSHYLEEGADGVVLRLRAFDGDLTAIRLEYWDGANWNSESMSYDSDLAGCDGQTLAYGCDLWVAPLVAYSSGALAYRFAAADGTDTNYVGAGTPSTVYEDGLQPTVEQSFPFPSPTDAGPLPDASSGLDAATTPDAATTVDAAVPDAAVPDAAMTPDAAVTPDAGAIPDASVATDAGLSDAATAGDAASPTDASTPHDAAEPLDAALPVDASLPRDAATPPDAARADAATTIPDAGPSDAGTTACTPGCRSPSERVVCSSLGLATVLLCTAGTECQDGMCVTPQEEEPEEPGCACTSTGGTGEAFLAMVALAAVKLRRRRR